MNSDAVDLSVMLGKIKLRNPVMPAAGTFGYGEEFGDFLNLKDLGAVVVKGTTLEPRLGNFQNRSVEVAGCCFLTAVGLQNVGVHRFIEDKLPYLRKFGTPVIVNAGCKSIEEFVELVEVLNKAEGVDGIEVNMGCPNVEYGGLFGSNPDTAFTLIKAIRNATDLTIIAKVPSAAADIVAVSKACEKAGADVISPAMNSRGMAIDINTRRSKLGKNLTGGVLGPGMKPIAVKVVWEVAQAVNVPVVGSGGITGAEDALEFIIAGATAIQIGTYNLIDPRVTIKTIEGIRKYLIEKEIRSVNDIIGSMILS